MMKREKGKLAIWFEELYAEIRSKPMYKGLIPYKEEVVHDGYFSVDKKRGKIVGELDTRGGTARDDETYELIMKVKSRDNRTPYDSGVEEEAVELLDSDDKVKFFCKLPRWFKVSIPIGDYNPDWVVVVENSHKFYQVRETKSKLDRDKRFVFSRVLVVLYGRYYFYSCKNHSLGTSP